ncbi:MAG: hypothetical protein ABIN21_03935 [candidate division WOR-3 bacterium]
MQILIFFLFNITPISYWTAGNSRFILKKDTLLYLASGGTVLTYRFGTGIPQFKKEISLEGTIFDIDFIGDTVFLSGEFGIRIFNIQNLNNPQLIGNYSSNEIRSYENLFPYGYGVSSGKIKIFNLNTPNSPETLFTYSLPSYINRIEIFSNLGFAVSGDTIYILNLQNPVTPSVYSKLKTSLFFQDIYKRNDSLFVLTGDSFKIFRIQNPSTPQYLYGFQTTGFGQNFELFGNTLIVALSFSGVATYNFTNGNELAHSYFFSNCVSLTKSGSYIYAADLDLGLITLSYPTLFTLDTFSTPQITYRTKVISDSILVLASGLGGVFFLNVRNKQKPFYMNSIETSGTSFDIEVYGDTLLYVADGFEGVKVFKIKNIYSPVEMGYVAVNGYAKSLSLNFPYLYTANGPGYGFSILNVSNPTKPREIINYPTSGSGEDVLFYPPNYLLLADGNSGTKIFDISDTNNIILITNLPSYGFAQSLKINGSKLAVAEGWTGGLSLWDITNITAPQFYSNFSTPGFGFDVEFIRQDTLIVADGQVYGLRKISITDPYNPTETEYKILFGEPRGLFYLNGFLYTSLGPLGISIVNPHITYISEVSFISRENEKEKRIGLLYLPEFLKKEKNSYNLLGRKIDIKNSGIYIIKRGKTLYKFIKIK